MYKRQLYDGGNVDDGSLIVSYLQSQGVEQLEYVFCSHAHEDHVGGLAAALAYFPAYHVYSPVTDASTKCFQDFVKYTPVSYTHLHTGELVMDMGTVLDGRRAVKEKLIDELGGLSDALAWLYKEIERK